MTNEEFRQRCAEALGWERDSLGNLHEPGCPVMYDDESDQVLHDFGICTCENLPAFTRVDEMLEVVSSLDYERRFTIYARLAHQVGSMLSFLSIGPREAAQALRQAMEAAWGAVAPASQEDEG